MYVTRESRRILRHILFFWGGKQPTNQPAITSLSAFSSIDQMRVIVYISLVCAVVGMPDVARSLVEKSSRKSTPPHPPPPRPSPPPPHPPPPRPSPPPPHPPPPGSIVTGGADSIKLSWVANAFVAVGVPFFSTDPSKQQLIDMNTVYSLYKNKTWRACVQYCADHNLYDGQTGNSGQQCQGGTFSLRGDAPPCNNTVINGNNADKCGGGNNFANYKYNTPSGVATPSCWLTYNSPSTNGNDWGSAFDGRFDPSNLNLNTAYSTSSQPISSGVIGFSAVLGLTSMLIVSVSTNANMMVAGNTNQPPQSAFQVPGRRNEDTTLGDCVASCLTQATYGNTDNNRYLMCFGGYVSSSSAMCNTVQNTINSWPQLSFSSQQSATAFSVVKVQSTGDNTFSFYLPPSAPSPPPSPPPPYSGIADMIGYRCDVLHALQACTSTQSTFLVSLATYKQGCYYDIKKIYACCVVCYNNNDVGPLYFKLLSHEIRPVTLGIGLDGKPVLQNGAHPPIT